MRGDLSRQPRDEARATDGRTVERPRDSPSWCLASLFVRFESRVGAAAGGPVYRAPGAAAVCRDTPAFPSLDVRSSAPPTAFHSGQCTAAHLCHPPAYRATTPSGHEPRTIRIVGHTCTLIIVCGRSANHQKTPMPDASSHSVLSYLISCSPLAPRREPPRWAAASCPPAPIPALARGLRFLI